MSIFSSIYASIICLSACHVCFRDMHVPQCIHVAQRTTWVSFLSWYVGLRVETPVASLGGRHLCFLSQSTDPEFEF